MDLMDLRLPLSQIELLVVEDHTKLTTRLTALGQSLLGTVHLRDFVDLKDSIESDLVVAEAELREKRYRSDQRTRAGWLKADIESYTRTYLDTYCRTVGHKNEMVTKFLEERKIVL